MEQGIRTIAHQPAVHTYDCGGQNVPFLSRYLPDVRRCAGKNLLSLGFD